jgi:drug/metabolite transporter (DMT)-like permease
MAVLILILNSKLEYWMWNFLIVIASIIAPFLNFFQKKAIQKIEIYNVLFLRYFLSFFLMLFFILFTEKNIDIVKYLFDIKFILSAMLNWLIFFALSKILWLNSIKKICITYWVAILNTTPLFSILFLLFFWIFPDFFQILASILLILWLFVFIKNEKECKL